jgi:cell division protein FtsL
MKIKVLEIALGIAFTALIAGNIFVFVSSMKLSGQIEWYEQKIGSLSQENLQLQQNAYEANSLTRAASVAASLDFTHKASPYYLAHPEFARSQ